MVRRANLSDRQQAERPGTGERGFSLVEVLVTLAIMAFASALIIATARPFDPLRSEAERLSRTIEQLDARARISGKPTGLVIEPGRYAAMTWSGGTWSALRGHTHTLNAKVRIRSAKTVTITHETKDEAPASPTLIFDPLGHTTSAPLVLISNMRELTVTPLDTPEIRP